MAIQIPFNHDFLPEYGPAEDVAPGLRRVTARNPGPFTFRGTGTYIVGHGKVAVIDPGPDMDDHVAALLAALEGEVVSHILITHTHNDHAPASRALAKATGAPVLGHGPHGSGKLEQGIVVEEGGDRDFIPDRQIRHGDVIEGDGWTLEAVHTPGHTSNHLCFAWHETEALFSGDHVMGWSTSVISPPDGDMGEYMRSLDLLRKRDDMRYWPTHGAAIEDPGGFIDAFIAHRHEREDQILACVADGRHTIEDMLPVVYQGVAPAVMGAAARSLLATVIHLCETGRLSSEGLVSISARFHVRKTG